MSNIQNFNATSFCNDYNIPYAQNGKHYREGWVNCACPMCSGSGSSGYHLGFNTKDGYVTCYRCGSHTLYSIISALINKKEAYGILKKYSTATEPIKREKYTIETPSELIFPSGTNSLTQKAKKYLLNRNFNPEKLIMQWNLLSTPHYGFYKNRICAPIYQNNKLVSFQCRDITGKHDQKYLACFQNEEIIQHQHCVYGLDQTNHDTCIIVEGITDVWRLGTGAVATFGIAFTRQQARLIASTFKKVFIMFDSEQRAQMQAEELGFLISNGFRHSVKVIILPFLIENSDPGDLKQDDADAIMKEIGL